IAVASTLILGYKADLSNDVLQAYSKTGTVHVLSVSGAHVAILFILLSFMLDFMDKYKYGKPIKALLIVSIIWYYALLTGFSPAVCRAAVMITMYIIGKAYNRHISTLNILAVSAFFLLLYDPLFITDVGFQLSYLAVFGLVVLQPVVYNWLDLKNKWADKLWALCSVSIAAQVITFPLSAFYFHQFPVYFLVSNLFIIIPSAIIMYTGLAYLFLPSIPFISPALAFILEHTILLMNKVLTVIEHTPYAGINKIWITTTEYVLLYVIIISIFYFLYAQKKWLLKLSLCCMLLLATSLSIKRWKNLTRNEITFLNLRKHTGIVFKAGNKAIVVSDLADTDKTYRYSVQPYLDSCQVNSVKVLAPDSNFQSGFFIKQGPLMQIMDKRVLLFDKHLQNSTLAEKLKVDYTYISGNPKTDIGFLNKNYGDSFLIIDGTNYNPLITRLQESANQRHINYWMLRRNKSITVVSN
ncbi:MAG: ComEC/Rec2 family competence protein, partial [Mucilaginibacter sp.]